MIRKSGIRLSLTSAYLDRFPAKACPALDAGWMPVRVKKTRQNKEIEPPFRFNRNGKGSAIIELRQALSSIAPHPAGPERRCGASSVAVLPPHSDRWGPPPPAGVPPSVRRCRSAAASPATAV